MTESDLLLSDEFINFSKQISTIYDEKKIVEEEFKKHFEEYKNKKKEFESRVAEANSNWEEWKKSQLTNKK
jgi:hypothetical protein